MPFNHGTQYANLTDEQYAAIGRVVVEWANVEYLLSVLLSRLLRTPEYLGRTYASGLSAVKLQSAISEAVDIHRHRYGPRFVEEATLRSIEELSNHVTTLRSERNRISHFCWSRWSDESVFGTSFAGGVPTEKWERRNSRSMSLSELKSLHGEAYAVAEELMRIVTNIQAINEVGV